MTIECPQCKRTVGIQISEESMDFRMIEGQLRMVPGCGHANVMGSKMQCACGKIL